MVPNWLLCYSASIVIDSIVLMQAYCGEQDEYKYLKEDYIRKIWQRVDQSRYQSSDC
jgi:hypothetical protein